MAARHGAWHLETALRSTLVIRPRGNGTLAQNRRAGPFSVMRRIRRWLVQYCWMQ
jgi:hypothetical protein